ncbi:MAG: SIR2 family protein [Candidatus Omnitrophica bacterium]|nr:SIR2 family protein [Candidatus Omnitrophota bacterium]
MSLKKIVYLFGAGATHAEIINSESSPDETFRENYGLLIASVSKRVIKRAQRQAWFKKHEEIFASAKGEFNIELFISLFEINEMPDYTISSLKKLVQEDIKRVLSNNRRQKFYLHKAFFELHNKIEDREKLLGIISLNYDNIIDEAYEKILGSKPNYCLTSEAADDKPSLLKLHGSFNWNRITIYEKRKKISIIPIGINKNYLAPPYNFIWGRAYELLVKCDVLRIVGCSLNQNDIGLIDLLFKAHRERGKSIEIQIIDFQPPNGHHQIKRNYGFFPSIVEPNKIEETLIADETISNCDVGNPFKIWLKAKAEKMLQASEINNTKYLKKCL